MTAEIRRPLARGDVVLADRYAWTAVAREIARGLEPDWVAALYRFMPRPDLVIFHRQEPAAAHARALATRPTRSAPKRSPRPTAHSSNGCSRRTSASRGPDGRAVAGAVA